MAVQPGVLGKICAGFNGGAFQVFIGKQLEVCSGIDGITSTLSSESQISLWNSDL